MKVINVLGIPFKFVKNNTEYMIPFDNKSYYIPDECLKDNFNGVFRVVEFPSYFTIPTMYNNIIEIDLGNFDTKEENPKEEIKEETPTKTEELPKEETPIVKEAVEKTPTVKKDKPLKGKGLSAKQRQKYLDEQKAKKEKKKEEKING
jgi:hypothetical protein